MHILLCFACSTNPRSQAVSPSFFLFRMLKISCIASSIYNRLSPQQAKLEPSRIRQKLRPRQMDIINILAGPGRLRISGHQMGEEPHKSTKIVNFRVNAPFGRACFGDPWILRISGHQMGGTTQKHQNRQFQSKRSFWESLFWGPLDFEDFWPPNGGNLTQALKPLIS